MHPFDKIDADKNVSRETLERLEIYLDELRKWQPTINLVSGGEIKDLWVRHVEDSIQLSALINKNQSHYVDLGSGGGFPGIIIALFGADSGRIKRATLIESDARKCAFLREASRKLDLPINVLTMRAENTSPQNASVITARALASLDKLMAYAYRHLSKDGTAFFPKGATYHDEIKEAEKKWHFSVNPIRSRTNPAAAILEIKSIFPREKDIVS